MRVSSDYRQMRKLELHKQRCHKDAAIFSTDSTLALNQSGNDQFHRQ